MFSQGGHSREFSPKRVPQGRVSKTELSDFIMASLGVSGHTLEDFTCDVAPSRRDLGHRTDFAQKNLLKGPPEAIQRQGRSISWHTEERYFDLLEEVFVSGIVHFQKSHLWKLSRAT